METHLYSKRKCLLLSCTICQRTFVCLFYYCLYNSFLFIEHSSMSVKCFFFSYMNEQNPFCMFKDKQSSMYWAIEKSKQTSTNSLENMKHSHTRPHPTHILSSLCKFVFAPYGQVNPSRRLFANVTRLSPSTSDVCQRMSLSHWSKAPAFIL